MQTAKSLIRKAALVTSDLSSNGGLMQEAQALRFIHSLVTEARLLSDVRTVGMTAQKQQIDKISFPNRVLRPGKENTALSEADVEKPTTAQVELDSKLLKAETQISDESLQDNIEGEQLRSTILEILRPAVSRDLEELVIDGDTASSDAFLAVLDGIRKQSTSNTVAAGSVSLTKDILRDMLKTLPARFHRMRSMMRFYTSVKAVEDYADSLGDRATGLGDKQHEQNGVVPWRGIPVVPVPLFPDDLGGSSDETEVLLTNPLNIVLGIWRQIRLEDERNIRAGAWLVVTTLRADVKYEEEEAVVQATGVTN